jgi:hypothetical protein
MVHVQLPAYNGHPIVILCPQIGVLPLRKECVYCKYFGGWLICVRNDSLLVMPVITAVAPVSDPRACSEEFEAGWQSDPNRVSGAVRCMGACTRYRSREYYYSDNSPDRSLNIYLSARVLIEYNLLFIIYYLLKIQL